MISGRNNIENKLYDQLLVVQALVYTNKQANDEIKQDCDYLKNKLNKHDFGFS